MRAEKPLPVPLTTLEERFKLNAYVIICKDNVFVKKRAVNSAMLWSS
jgi:hypothetical protein